MAIPFLPAELISPIFIILPKPQFPASDPTNCTILLNRTSKERGICQVKAEKLSTFDVEAPRNNGAENYHAKLKSIIKSPHPTIWNFLTILNEVIAE